MTNNSEGRTPFGIFFSKGARNKCFKLVLSKDSGIHSMPIAMRKLKLFVKGCTNVLHCTLCCIFFSKSIVIDLRLDTEPLFLSKY